MKSHPWHEVSIGKKVPELVNGIIEIPKNHRAKYELDKESGMLILDRFYIRRLIIQQIMDSSPKPTVMTAIL